MKHYTSLILVINTIVTAYINWRIMLFVVIISVVFPLMKDSLFFKILIFFLYLTSTSYVVYTASPNTSLGAVVFIAYVITMTVVAVIPLLRTEDVAEI